MKVLTVFCAIITISATLFAQAPQAFNYQAIARDASGNAMAEKTIALQISILLDNDPAQVIYVEIQVPLTDQMGLFNIAVGYGDVQSGEFQDIDWGNGTYFLQVEIDPEGGTNFQYLGSMQLLSVPFALYADASGGDADWSLSGDNMSSAPTGNVGIGTETPQAKLSVIGGIKSSNNEAGTDYLELKHGANNASLKWGGTGDLDFRYEGNTLMSIFQDGRIGLGADYAASSAILQLNSSTRGFRPPKMSASKIAAIEDPKNGLMVFNNTDEHLYVFRENEGGVWQRLKYDDEQIEPEPWECGDAIIDQRDQTSYSTVQISEQCWMAENLNIGDKIDGINDQTDNQTIEKYCFDDNEVNCDTYGGLYQWDEAMKYTVVEGSQGICPENWHIPTDEEWKMLEGEVDSQWGYPDPEWDNTGIRGLDVGLNLKSTFGWDGNGNGTDSYGFRALPGGWHNHYGTFENLGYYCRWWTSSEGFGTGGAWSRSQGYDWDGSSRYWTDFVKSGRSIRCLKD
nr:hypothetical protein [Bacteroidota bacterium]